ncbi:hypothetical protein BC332_24182 [Capsicum chinense]|nr:hypothetical protein BC332_24182 [Capsicum chinense]
MASSKLISSLFFLSCIAILVQTVISMTQLNYACSESGTFPDGSPYAQNLEDLLADLNSKTPITGFFTSSMGTKPDRAYGLSLCRGDISGDDCKTCVLAAREEITKLCPNNKEAIIWYDYCLLKYSDDCFKGEIDDTNKFSMCNIDSVPEAEVEKFMQVTRALLQELAKEAYMIPQFYATRETPFINSQKLYGLVQCTRDLSNWECKKCLDDIISELSRSCYARIGGRIIGGSCKFRFEMYPFANGTIEGVELLNGSELINSTEIRDVEKLLPVGGIGAE